MNTPATRSLAICGWTPEAAEALDALVATGAFVLTGIADASGAALVEARRVTGLPCFQQARQFLTSAEYDAVLLASPQSAPLVALAASRGADLLLLPDACDLDTLEAATEAARAHGVRLTLLRPEMHDPGVEDLAGLLASHDDWAPQYLDITVEGATDVDRLLGIAVAHAVRLAGDRHGLVRASAWIGTDTRSRAISATLEAYREQLHLRVRHAPEAYIRIAGEAPAGAFELRISGTDHGADATLTYTTPSGDRVRYQPKGVHHWTAEAARTLAADDSVVAPDDSALAREEAGLLGAIARSILTGEVQANDCCSRPELRLIEGRGHLEPRRGGLRLIVS